MSFSDPISHTARFTAAARARETRRPDRLFEDPWAEILAGPEGFDLLARWEQAARPPNAPAGMENPYIAIRTRYFDDFLARTLATSDSTGAAPPIRQVVILAAGLDTRAFRLSWPPATRLFELDRPDLLAVKAEILSGAGARPRCDRLPIPADLAAAGWSDLLVAGGFDARAPVVWIVEGLLPYLDEAQTRALLAECASLTSSGSWLVADIVGKSFLDSPYTRAYLEWLREQQVPWRFGTDEPEAFLASFGWNATARRPGDEGAAYGRWPYLGLPRGTPGYPSIYYVTAARV